MGDVGGCGGIILAKINPNHYTACALYIPHEKRKRIAKNAKKRQDTLHMRRWRRQLIVSAILALGMSGVASATLGDPSSSSSNYSVIEGEIGGNGQFNSSSSSYSINPNIDNGGSSLGESAVGNSSSNSYQTGSGFNTTAEPTLTFVINTSLVNLGALSTSTATFGTATFNVKNYSSSGYAVTILGNTPVYAGHNLAAMTTDTASSAGTEQFGINTVRNTSAAQGANPIQIPSSSFSYGVAGDGITGTYGTTRPYTIPDKWRYNSGETIASGAKSSGETDFTMSFIANISTLTPGGQYTGAISLIATGTY